MSQTFHRATDRGNYTDAIRPAVSTLAGLRLVPVGDTLRNAVCFASGVNCFYAYDPDSEAADDDDQVVAPTVGNGRWLKIIVSGSAATARIGTLYDVGSIAAAEGVSSVVVTSLFLSETPGGSGAVSGIVTSAPANWVALYDATTQRVIHDSTGSVLYGRLTYAAGVWTLSLVTMRASGETAYTTLRGHTLRLKVVKTYPPDVLPVVPPLLDPATRVEGAPVFRSQNAPYNMANVDRKLLLTDAGEVVLRPPVFDGEVIVLKALVPGCSYRYDEGFVDVLGNTTGTLADGECLTLEALDVNWYRV